MLDKLFPSFYQSSANGTNLSSGGSPETLQGTDKEILSKLSSVPSQVSQKDVQDVAKNAGNLEANTVLLKAWSEQALTAQTAALSNLDVRLQHAQLAMKNEESYRKKIAKHGKNVLEHRVDVSATRSNLDGYQQALNNATDTIYL